jgi:hypothetical protein
MKYMTIVVSTLIVIAVLIPGSDLPDISIGGYDKVVHLAMFAAWAVAVRYDFKSRFRIPIIFCAGLLFSVITEALQLLVEGRSFDVYDMIADAAGLIAGLLISGPLLRLVTSK